MWSGTKVSITWSSWRETGSAFCFVLLFCFLGGVLAVGRFLSCFVSFCILFLLVFDSVSIRLAITAISEEYPLDLPCIGPANRGYGVDEPIIPVHM